MGEPERDEDAYTKLIVERAAAIVERDAAIAERNLALNRLQALAAGDQPSRVTMGNAGRAADRNERRNITIGQKAMGYAMVFPRMREKIFRPI